jgi:MinD superfamily P-loop ATPase
MPRRQQNGMQPRIPLALLLWMCHNVNLERAQFNSRMLCESVCAVRAVPTKGADYQMVACTGCIAPRCVDEVRKSSWCSER